MARTIKAYLPSGMTSVSVQLYDESDTEVESIVLTESTNALGVYTGTIVTAGVGIFDAVVSGDSGSGKSHKGTYGYTRILGQDPEIAIVGDAHGIPDGVKLQKQIERDNVSGDQLTETIRET